MNVRVVTFDLNRGERDVVVVPYDESDERHVALYNTPLAESMAYRDPGKHTIYSFTSAPVTS